MSYFSLVMKWHLNRELGEKMMAVQFLLINQSLGSVCRCLTALIMIEIFSITMTEEVEYNKNDSGLLDKDNVGLIVGLSPISSQSSGNDITVCE